MTLVVDNVKVAGVNKVNNDWISLSKVYKKKILPIEKEEVATPENVSKLKYLDSIKSEITQTDDIEIGMLIGANCMKALEPQNYSQQRWWSLCILNKTCLLYCWTNTKCWTSKFTKVQYSEGCINWQIFKAPFSYWKCR